MRYYKGYIALSETCDVPVLQLVRNCRAICFEQLRDLLAHDMLVAIVRSLRWRVTRLEKCGLIMRLDGQKHSWQTCLRNHPTGARIVSNPAVIVSLSLPSDTEQILHPSKVTHALELVNIRLALARSGLLRAWKSDLEITSRNLVAPEGATKDYDAVAEIESGGAIRRVGIEYERSAKAASRYAAICAALDKDQTTDIVLYLTPNDDILYLLAMELRATRKHIGLALCDSFRHSILETRTLTNEGSSEVLPLRELLYRATA